MIKRILIFSLIVIVAGVLPAQNFSNLWQGHFSYNNIVDIAKSETKIYAAAENAVFSYDTQTNDIETITTVEGLSGEEISTVHFSEEFETLIIGYNNGLMELYFESDEEILSIVDILDKITISPDNKRINHFNEHDGLIYVSANFGISVYNLERLEFGDSYFLGNGGSQIEVTQSTVFENFIYASCKDGNGIKKRKFR